MIVNNVDKIGRRPLGPRRRWGCATRSNEPLSAMTDYGYRMVIKQRHRQGWKVGKRRVRRIMREDNMLCLRRRRPAADTCEPRGAPSRGRRYFFAVIAPWSSQ
jgi:transposase InsO family protein